MAGLHGADGDVADGLAGGCFAREEFTVEVGDDQLQRGVGEELAVRDAADELYPVLRKPASQDLGKVGV